MRKHFFLLFLFMVLLVSTITAVKPITETSTSLVGFDIEYPPIEQIQKDKPYEFEFHVFNKSDGLPIYENINCYFHLYNETGQHILEMENSIPDHVFDYTFNIGANNFTRVAQFNYILQCNNSKVGGFVASELIITETGNSESEHVGSATVAIAILLGTILIGLFSLMIVTPSIDLKMILTLLIMFVILISFYFAHTFIKIVDPNEIGIINNLLVMYEISLTFFKFAFAVIAFILMLRVILSLRDFNAKRKKKKEKWDLSRK